MNWNRVYDLVKKIPRGRAMTYGQVAKALRLAGGARTAGRAMAACPSGKGCPGIEWLALGESCLSVNPTPRSSGSCSKRRAWRSRKKGF